MGRTERHRAKREERCKPLMLSNQFEVCKFLSSNGWSNTKRLTVSEFQATGRGLFAKRNLCELDMIIELPYQSMISYRTIENDIEFFELFSTEKLESAKTKVSFQALLALYLQHQKFIGESSRWTTYVKTLPEAIDTPYFCKKSELYHLPDFLLERIVAQNEAIKSNFSSLLSLLQPEAEQHFTLETFKWAYFACNSRSVYLDYQCLEPLTTNHNFGKILSDTPNMALAPLLDLLLVNDS